MTTASGFRFKAVMAVTFFIMFGYGMIVPTLPLFASTLGVAETGIGIVFTAFAGARLAASIFAGSAIGKLGERRMAAMGAFIVGVSSAAAGFSPNFPSLVILRGLGGIGSAFFLAALMTSLLGAVKPEERSRAMAMFWAVVGVGFIVGPVFGGLAAIISLRAPLFFYGGICMAAAPLCYMVLGPGPRDATAEGGPSPVAEEVAPIPAVPAWQMLKPLLRDPAYRAALAVGAASFFVMGGVDPLVSKTWTDGFGLSESSVGIPFMLAGLATLGPAWHAGKLGDLKGRKYATVPALALSAVALAMLGLFHSPVAFVIMFTVVGLSWGYQRSGPSAIVGDVSTDSDRAMAVGGFRIATDVGAFLGPTILGAIGEHQSHAAAFMAAGGVVLLAFFAMLPVRETAPAVVAAAARSPHPAESS
ncbi:MAG TPA: MFS transporter [Actinomycetota bacterium]